jgi:signal transduction histidine kinase
VNHAQTRLVNHVSQCPFFSDSQLKEAPGSCFVCVPLRYQDRVLGIMNIIYDYEQDFTESDFRLLDSIGYHIGLALENAELYEHVKQKEEARGKLLGSVITAQEEERKRVAREIHDEYGQTLAGLMLSIESLEGLILPEQNHLKDKIEGAKKTVTLALEDMRRLALDLRPAALDDLGLAAAIRSYARGSLEAAGIKVKLEMEGLSRRLAPAIETAIFRIIQESLHNVVKHANADSVTIRLQADTVKIVASIEDNGRGFDISSLKSKNKAKSLGLIGIQERTAILGGNFHIDSQPGHGTQIRIEIPLNGTLAAPLVGTVRTGR